MQLNEPSLADAEIIIRLAGMTNAKIYWKNIRKLQYLINPQYQIPCVRISMKNVGNAGKTQSNRLTLPTKAGRPGFF